MNYDLVKAVYIKCWENFKMLLVSPYNPQVTAVKADWVRRVKPLLSEEKSRTMPDI